MKRLLFAFCALLLILSIASAFADDLTPPSWRGQAGTTYQAWEFNTNSQTPAPDASYNPNGVASILVTPGFMQTWQPNWGGRDGVWPLSGQIEVTIPNYPVQNPYKDIWLQLTWAEQAPGNTPVAMVTAPINSAMTLTQQTALGGGWYHSLYQIRLEPNPNQESLLITGGINVDELVIDTRCYSGVVGTTPEPGSLLALSSGLGLLGFAIRRRR